MLGCAHSRAAHPLTLLSLPVSLAVQREGLDALARSLFSGLRTRRVPEVLVTRGQLDELLTPQARLHVEWEREHTYAVEARAWEAARYSGFCAQGLRREPALGGYGLRAPAWVVGRMLVVAHNGERRSASWIEGRFVYTDQGFKALSLGRMESPRAHHTDLELAPCDVEDGFR
jgi:hypothetical protein